MGSLLEKPKMEKQNESGEGSDIRWCTAQMQGWRVEMEDTHLAVLGMGTGYEDWNFFAVFDGHAGGTVSKYLSKNLINDIMQKIKSSNGNEVEKAIVNGFLDIDAAMQKLLTSQDKSGSTAVCSIVTPDQIFFANCGDSRAVLCRNGVPVFSTKDHKPKDPDERDRIQRAGGSVMLDRINGMLAVSRALGDYDYKNSTTSNPAEQLVSPAPDVWVQTRVPGDEFLILACDGIWDVMSNEEICTYIHNQLLLTIKLDSIINRLLDICLYKGSLDNMSVVLVVFSGAPKPPLDAGIYHPQDSYTELIEKWTNHNLSHNLDS